KIFAWLSRGMPMPVSLTAKCNTGAGGGPGADGSGPVGVGSAPASTRTTTSPCSVNLMALPMRLSRTCRSRPASPTRASGTSGWIWQASVPQAQARLAVHVHDDEPVVLQEEGVAGMVHER